MASTSKQRCLRFASLSLSLSGVKRVALISRRVHAVFSSSRDESGKERERKRGRRSRFQSGCAREELESARSCSPTVRKVSVRSDPDWEPTTSATGPGSEQRGRRRSACSRLRCCSRRQSRHARHDRATASAAEATHRAPAHEAERAAPQAATTRAQSPPSPSSSDRDDANRVAAGVVLGGSRERRVLCR